MRLILFCDSLYLIVGLFFFFVKMNCKYNKYVIDVEVLEVKMNDK